MKDKITKLRTEYLKAKKDIRKSSPIRNPNPKKKPKKAKTNISGNSNSNIDINRIKY